MTHEDYLRQYCQPFAYRASETSNEMPTVDPQYYYADGYLTCAVHYLNRNQLLELLTNLFPDIDLYTHPPETLHDSVQEKQTTAMEISNWATTLNQEAAHNIAAINSLNSEHKKHLACIEKLQSQLAIKEKQIAQNEALINQLIAHPAPSSKE